MKEYSLQTPQEAVKFGVYLQESNILASRCQGSSVWQQEEILSLAVLPAARHSQFVSHLDRTRR